MATSNRERMGPGFELLAVDLSPFVDRMMSAAAGAAGEWLRLLAARGNAKHGSAKAFSKDEPALLLKVLAEDWRVFKDVLSRPNRRSLPELRDTRNKWAHNEPFSPLDTYRAMDSMERLLTAATAVEQAEGLRRLRLDHQRVVYETETRKAVKAGAVASVPGAGLKPWREIVTPQPDVASGQYNAAEFAADLHMVARDEGSREYVDPVEFFRRTYLTEGLRDLLSRATRRLSGDLNASPIVNLQTNFGGGKTHSMLALYHLCSGRPVTDFPQELQELLGPVNVRALGDVKRVTLVGRVSGAV